MVPFVSVVQHSMRVLCLLTILNIQQHIHTVLYRHTHTHRVIVIGLSTIWNLRLSLTFYINRKSGSFINSWYCHAVLHKNPLSVCLYGCQFYSLAVNLLSCLGRMFLNQPLPKSDAGKLGMIPGTFIIFIFLHYKTINHKFKY